MRVKECVRCALLTGSRKQHVDVSLEGVPAHGTIDGGVDITIIGEGETCYGEWQQQQLQQPDACAPVKSVCMSTRIPSRLLVVWGGKERPRTSTEVGGQDVTVGAFSHSSP